MKISPYPEPAVRRSGIILLPSGLPEGADFQWWTAAKFDFVTRSDMPAKVDATTASGAEHYAFGGLARFADPDVFTGSVTEFYLPDRTKVVLTHRHDPAQEPFLLQGFPDPLFTMLRERVT